MLDMNTVYLNDVISNGVLPVMFYGWLFQINLANLGGGIII